MYILFVTTFILLYLIFLCFCGLMSGLAERSLHRDEKHPETSSVWVCECWEERKLGPHTLPFSGNTHTRFFRNTPEFLRFSWSDSGVTLFPDSVPGGADPVHSGCGERHTPAEPPSAGAGAHCQTGELHQCGHQHGRHCRYWTPDCTLKSAGKCSQKRIINTMMSFSPLKML